MRQRKGVDAVTNSTLKHGVSMAPKNQIQIKLFQFNLKTVHS